MYSNNKTMLRDMPDVLNIEQLCSALDISKKTAYKLLQNEDIHAIKVGRAYRIPKIFLIQYLTQPNSVAE